MKVCVCNIKIIVFKYEQIDIVHTNVSHNSYSINQERSHAESTLLSGISAVKQTEIVTEQISIAFP